MPRNITADICITYKNKAFLLQESHKNLEFNLVTITYNKFKNKFETQKGKNGLKTAQKHSSHHGCFIPKIGQL